MTRASTRDASFYRRPNVRSPKVYHVIDKPGMSACGRMLYDQGESYANLSDSIDAADAPPGLRCQRPGCKSRWPNGVGGTPPNPRKLTECQGRPRCEKCLTMDGTSAAEPGPLLMFSLNYINGFMVGESEEVRRHWKRIYAHVYGVNGPLAGQRQEGGE